jgi:HAD superfamily hydrolase (TIGR01509 family)
VHDLQLLIFDCDGVLVDSETVAVDVEVDLLVGAGYAIDREEMIRRYSGMSWNDLLKEIERTSGRSLPRSLADRSDAVLDERLERDVEAIAGVALTVSRLPYPRCICSNTKMPRLDMMLSKVGLWPLFAPHIFSAKDLGEGRSKPKPDIFLHGARAMGAEPNKVIVIEDSVYGVQGARAAGMRVIGFTGGSHTYPTHAKRLIEHGAETTIANIEDLPAAITSLIGG